MTKTVEILQQVDSFRNKVASLKEIAPMFPEIYMQTDSAGTVWVTSMVRFEYNGVAYKRHHVESVRPTKTCTPEDAVDRLNQNAKLCQEKAIPCVFDEVIGVIPKN